MDGLSFVTYLLLQTAALQNVTELTASKQVQSVSTNIVLNHAPFGNSHVFENTIGDDSTCATNMNLALKRFNAKTTNGENPGVLLGESWSNGYTSHPISYQPEVDSIVVKLGAICSINYIKIHLRDDEPNYAYSYYIEVSTDAENWEKVIDYTRYDCRGWQRLYFPGRKVRYIRVVGTGSATNDNRFYLHALEAKYKTQLPDLACGFVKSVENVVTSALQAQVIEGEYPDALLNNNRVDFVRHTIGRDSIVVQLNQPYIIDTLNIRLFDFAPSREYSFYILTSYDKRLWTMAVDKRDKLLSSWQTFTFEPRPVVYIKIIGTRNTLKDNGFHLMKLECSSQLFNYSYTCN